MPRTSYGAEEMIGKLREAEVALSKGATVGEGHSPAWGE